MQLRRISFRPVLNASGVRGFFGTGFRFQEVQEKCRVLNWSGVGMVAKTTPLNSREGNMQIRSGDYVSAAMFPDCLAAERLSRVYWNAVSLSSPGLDALLCRGVWQSWTEPFMLSFTSVAPTRAQRENESRIICSLLKGEKFRASFAVILDPYCPNLGINLRASVEETLALLDIYATLDRPLIVKPDVSMTTEEMLALNAHEACDGLALFNAVRYQSNTDKVDWGTVAPYGSPLKKYGGGAASGAFLYNLVDKTTRELRARGMLKAIIAHSMYGHRYVRRAHQAGVSAVAIGAGGLMFPWRIQRMRRTAEQLFR